MISQIPILKHKSAIKDYDEAIRLKHNYAYAYNDRGSAKRKLDDLTGAIADYTMAVKSDPGLSFAYNNLGSAKRQNRITKGLSLNTIKPFV